MEEPREYVLVPRRVVEERLDCIEGLLRQLISKEETMAAEQSAEARALGEAITALEAEVADVSAVDAEVVTDLEGVKDALGKVNPVSPEQVNAIATATSTLASLTAKLKAAGAVAAEAEAGAGQTAEAPAGGAQAAQEPAPAAGETTTTTAQAQDGAAAAGEAPAVPAPVISAISPVEGPAGTATPATITGAHLEGATVTVEGVAAADVVVAEDGTSLTCTVPASANSGSEPWAASVIVTTPGGTASTTYTYAP